MHALHSRSGRTDAQSSPAGFANADTFRHVSIRPDESELHTLFFSGSQRQPRRSLALSPSDTVVVTTHALQEQHMAVALSRSCSAAHMVRRQDLLLKRARAFMRLTHYTDALDDLSTIVELSASHDKGPVTAAAERKVETVTQGGERVAEALYYRGLCHVQLGALEAAEDDLTAALEADPHLRRAAYELAACHTRLGDLAGALEVYESVLTSETTEEEEAAGSVSSVKLNFLQRRLPRSRFAAARQKQRSREREGDLSVSCQQQTSSTKSSLQLWSSFLSSAPMTYGVQVTKGKEVGGVLHKGESEPSLLCVGEGIHSGGACETVAEDREEEGKGGSDLLSSNHLGPFAELLQRGLIHRKSGEFAEAVLLYSRILAIDPDHVKALFNRAFCLDRMGQFDRSNDDYARVLELEPDSACACYNLGISYDRAGDLMDAIRLFTRAISLDPCGNADFFHNRGFSYRKLGDYAEAIADYTRSIELNPHHFKAYYNRAFCKDRVGDCIGAVADYSAALRLAPASACALHNRGVALERLSHFEEALEDYTRATECGSQAEVRGAMHARALLHSRMGRHTEAETDFTAALASCDSVGESGAERATLMYHRGLARCSGGNLFGAVEDYTYALELLTNSAPSSCSLTSVTLLMNRAYVLRRLSQYERSAEDYSHVLNGTTAAVIVHRVKALSGRGYCLARLCRFAEAIEDYTRVLNADPANEHAQHNRRICCEMAGSDVAV